MAVPSIKRNFVYNIIYQILAIIVPLITSPYLSRTLGAEMIGINSWTYSVVFYFMIFAVLGVNNYGNRSIAAARIDKNKLSSTFCSIYACQFTTSFLMILLYLLYVIFFADQYKVIAALQIFYVLSYAFDITWFFYGLEEFKVTVTRNSVIKLTGLVCIFVFVHNPDDLWKYTLIISGTAFLGNILLWPFLLKRVKISIPKISEVLPHIKPIFILFIPLLAISIFANMDKYMIGRMSSVIENGYYENTDKIISIPKAIITALGTVMLPRTANMIASGEEEKSRKYIELTMVYTAIMSSALAFGMMAVSDIFSVVFWGEDFLPCGKLIMYMSPAIIFSVFGNVIRTQYLIPRAKDKEYTISLILGAIVNLCVNFILIPILGALGAVIGTLIAEFSMTFCQSLYVRKALPIKKYILEGVPFYLIGIVMFGAVYLLENIFSKTVVNLFLLIIIGAVIYMILSAIYIFKSKNEIICRLRKDLLRKIKKG